MEYLENIRDMHFIYQKKIRGGGKNVCKLCLFGRGGFGQAAANELLKEDIPVAYFIDNDKNKIGKPYRGIECVPLEYVKDNVDNYFDNNGKPPGSNKTAARKWDRMF